VKILIWGHAAASRDGQALKGEIRRVFGPQSACAPCRCGSCNGCESELQALNNPFYNLHRLGVFFTASPRFADLLLVTGPVTYAMRGPLFEAYGAMPEPKFVMAVGTARYRAERTAAAMPAATDWTTCCPWMSICRGARPILPQ